MSSKFVNTTAKEIFYNWIRRKHRKKERKRGKNIGDEEKEEWREKENLGCSRESLCETFSNRPAHRTKKNIHRVYRFLVDDDDERGVFQTVQLVINQNNTS